MRSEELARLLSSLSSPEVLPCVKHGDTTEVIRYRGESRALGAPLPGSRVPHPH